MVGNSSSCCALATLIFILTINFDAKICTAARSPHRKPASKVTKSNQFIQSTCVGTVYPQLCRDSLTPYASKIQESPARLAEAVLTIALAQGQSAAHKVSSLSLTRGMNETEAAAVRDCMATMRDCVAMLKKSLSAVRQLAGGKNVRVRIGNTKTWMSTALTDVNACMGSGLRNEVNGEVVIAGQLTSNALSLVNGFATSVLAKKLHRP